MLRPVMKQYRPTNGLDPPPDLPLRQTLLLKCGHFARRKPKGLWVRVHCDMCSMLAKERESKDERRAGKKKRREERKRKQQSKVERFMAKKKMASAKVAKKKDLKKKGGKLKKEKGAKTKVGRKLVLVGQHLFASKGSLLAKVIKAFQVADEHIMGENELVVAMEKAGAKAEGKKTVKKLIKGILRNMLRAGVVVKQREIKHNEELKAFVDGDKEEEEDDESESEEDEEESDDEEEPSKDEEDGEGEDAEVDDEKEEKPKPKKKVLGKKKKA